MKSLSRVVWSEGMYLGPHHFQAQSRYFEESFHFALSSLWFQPYGLTDCKLDADGLRNGTVSVIHARGIFPDGLVFEIPGCDPSPAPLAIGELFPPARESITISLSVPSRQPEGANCALSAANGQRLRYIGESRMLPDENTGKDERPVMMGRKNLQLFADTEPLEDTVALPLARVRRDSSGRFVFDPTFVPPCLQIHASESLMLLLQHLIETLEQKSAHLAAESRTDRRSAFEFSPGEIESFWLRHAVNSALGPLRHLWISKRCHPEELFVELSRLAGALCTFSLDAHPRSLPLYDHQDPGPGFLALDRHIRKHLDILLRPNCVAIPLTRRAEYFYEAEIADTRCFGRARWILSMRAAMASGDLITTTPQLVKLCSAQFVPELVKRSLPGLVLTHLPAPPAAVAPRVETEYFDVRRTGPCWDHLVRTKKVGVYVPGELRDPELELLVILEREDLT